MKSSAVVQYHLRKLIGRGLVTHTPGAQPPPDRGGTRARVGSVDVPVLGDIAAGVPIIAEEGEAIDLVQDIAGRGDSALRVRGDSMQRVGIHDGGLAVLQRHNVAAMLYDVDAEATRCASSPPTTPRRHRHPTRLWAALGHPRQACRHDAVLGRADAGALRVTRVSC